MSVAPNAGVVDLDTFLPPTAGTDGVQGQVPKPLAGEQDYVLTASGWVPLSSLGTLVYQGTWDASTNTPTLTSSVGTAGYYYVVSVAGNTDLNGITTWTVGDWALFNGSVWQKIEGGSTVDITGGQINNTLIGNLVPAAGTFTTLTATGQTSLGANGANNATFIAKTGTGAFPTLTVEHSSGNSIITAVPSSGNGSIVARAYGGAGSIQFQTNGASYAEQLRVSNTASAVNYVQVTGAATGGNPTISAQGSDSSISFNLNSKGAGDVRLVTGGATGWVRLFPNGTEVVRATGVASGVNYVNFTGATAGSAPSMAAAGTDTNISQVFQSKGTGAIDLAAGSSGVNISNGGTVTAITRTAIGGSYTSAPAMALTAPTTAGGVQATATCVLIPTNNPSIVSGGTGYTVGDVLTFVGGTGTAQQMTVTTVSGGVITAASSANTPAYTVVPTNPISVTGGTGSGATFSVASWCVGAITITNAGSGYVEQPTVTFSGGGGSGAAAYATVGATTTFRSIGHTGTVAMRFDVPSSLTSNVPIFRLIDTAGSQDSGIQVSAPNGGAILNAFGATNAYAGLFSSGTGQVKLGTGGTGQTLQFNVAHTASAVNYVQVTGSATLTGGPTISAQGSDFNIPLRLSSKGISAVELGNPAGWAGLTVTTTNNPNRIALNAPATGFIPTFSTAGVDTNAGMAFISKGTGAIDLAAGSSGVNISNGGTVTALTVTGGGGGGYTTLPSVAITAPTTAGGVQATASINANLASPNPTVVSGGTGYTVGDVLTIVGGTFSVVGQLTVSTVSAGVITAVTISTYGTYTALPTNPVSVTGGTGSSATFNVNWGVRSLTITNAGSGYVEQPTVSFSGGGGSGAAAYATVGGTAAIKSTGATLDLFTSVGRVGSLSSGSSVANQAYFNIFNNATNVGYYAAGSNSNISATFVSQGTSPLNFATNSTSGNQQFAVAHTASAVNYVQVTGGATGSSPQISAQGSDTNINIDIRTKGAGYVNVANNKANYFQFYGGNIGQTPTMYAWGSDLNVDLAVTTKGTGAVNATTGGGLQLKVADTASAVNYLQATGGATGSGVTLSAQGSDANVRLLLNAKGSSSGIDLLMNNSRQVFIGTNGSAVNYLLMGGTATGFGPAITAAGSDTNIPLVLQPKGTGALQAQQTDSTATGGNARGANAVDWQTLRSAANRVASGSFSVIGGGYDNTSGFACGVASGYSNSAIGSYTGVASGKNNIAGGGDFSSIVGGQSNTGAGFFNFVGAGQSNSGTSASAVTTQSATMNGTTAVTLSGSNANIKVGQLITGTSIASYTYVAAVSGTSLTLSQAASGSSTSTLSFYTPHGVVVGGGNNQATGSYSFIGGGGDAGTAANRNVASGDWSFVGNGRNNTASGAGSFLGGGGYYSGLGVTNNGNTASGDVSVVGGGISNVGSGFASGILGGQGNVANSSFSNVIGAYGTTRSIVANLVLAANYSSLATFAAGNSQSAILVLAKQTTDATATVLTSNSSAASTTNQVIIPNNSAYYFKGSVVAGVTAGGDTSAWSFEGTIKRGANAASTALVGTPALNLIGQDAGASTWVVALTADTTNGGLAVTVTGQAATTIRWVCKIETTEMTF